MSDARRVEPARDYDQTVDWERRLAREAPFFRDLFSRFAIDRIVDAGCGSAKHAIMFRTWGHEVVGVDPDEPMLAQAAENARAAGVELPLMRGAFGAVEPLVGTGWDCVLTLGNSLPHVDGEAGLRAALSDFAAIVRPGGVAVLHLLNHTRLIDGRIRMLPPAFRETPEGDRVFLKVMDHVADGILFDFVTLTRHSSACVGPSGVACGDPAESGWDLRSRRSLHAALPFDLLAVALGDAGFTAIEAYGDHSGKAFVTHDDESVIIVAQRAG